MTKAMSSATDSEFTPNEAIVSREPTTSSPDSLATARQISLVMPSAVSPASPAPPPAPAAIHRPVRM